MMQTSIPALAVSSLSAGYGRFDVVRDVSLDVAAGEAVALLGPNGAGKTTVLRAIMGLVRHRRGSIRVNGTETTGMPVHQVSRGYAALVPEGRRLFGNQSVEDNLLLGGLHLRRDRARVAGLLDSVYELFPVLHSYRNPEHERMVAALFAEEAPGLAVSLSSEVIPDIGEYERASTTAANAYLRPVVSR